MLQTFFQNIKSYLWDAEPYNEQRGAGDDCAPTSNNVFNFWNDAPNLSGVSVNTETALGVSAIYAAVTILSETIASLPFELFRQREAGPEPARRHPVYKLVNAEPSELMTSYSFRKAMVARALLLGESFARVVRDPITFRPTALVIMTGTVTVMETDTGSIFYVWDYASASRAMKRITLRSDEVIHLQRMTLDGVCGLNPLKLHRENIGQAIAATQYGGAFFGNGAHVSGVIESPSAMTPEGMEKIRGQWTKKYGGVRKVGSTAVLDNGMKFTKIGLTPQEAMLVDVRRFSVEEVSRMFNIPPHLLHNLERATFNNIEELGLSFVIYTILPWCKMIEQEMNRKVLTEKEKAAGTHFVRFNLNGLLRANTRARAELYRTMFQMGAMSPNEIRELENLNKRHDDGGDEYYVPLNMTNDPAAGASDAEPAGEGQSDNDQPQPNA